MKIGFKNFKKFADFPPIELSPITFIVGPNNSGKSSFIKAVALLWNNFNRISQSTSLNYPPFHDFSFEKLNQLYGWGDFVSFLNEDSYGHNMEFSWSDKTHKYRIRFGATSEELQENFTFYMNPPIVFFELERINDGEKLIYSTKDNKKWDVSMENINKTHLEEWLKYRIEWYNERINKKNGLNEIEDTLGENPFSKSEEYIKKVIEFTEIEKRTNFNLNHDIKIDRDNAYQLLSFISSPEWREKMSLTYNDRMFVRNTLADYAYYFLQGCLKDTFYIGNSEVRYVEAHNASHDVFLLANDKNNFLARTILGYFAKVVENDKIKLKTNETTIKKWICGWLDKLHIAQGYEIIRKYNGAAFEVKITKRSDVSYESNPEAFVDLGSLGTGSIQLFILLLQIGMALSEVLPPMIIEESEQLHLDIVGKIQEEIKGKIIILLEEPEQNLHPRLQSELAKLFEEAFEISKGRINFIVETHSEYLIRKTQVMVSKKKDTNYFRVYYFPENGLPYDMEYMKNGRFAKKFESGFFDEAANLTYGMFFKDEYSN